MGLTRFLDSVWTVKQIHTTIDRDRRGRPLAVEEEAVARNAGLTRRLQFTNWSLNPWTGTGERPDHPDNDTDWSDLWSPWRSR